MTDHYADPHEVKVAAVNMNEQVLWHRLMGHGSGFKPHGPVNLIMNDKTLVGYEQMLKCSCGVTRKQVLNLNGHPISNPYNYKDTEGYLMPKGFGRIVGAGKDALRLESIMRRLPAEKKKEED